jgi:hypothetical protein
MHRISSPHRRTTVPTVQTVHTSYHRFPISSNKIGPQAGAAVRAGPCCLLNNLYSGHATDVRRPPALRCFCPHGQGTDISCAAGYTRYSMSTATRLPLAQPPPPLPGEQQQRRRRVRKLEAADSIAAASCRLDVTSANTQESTAQQRSTF